MKPILLLFFTLSCCLTLQAQIDLQRPFKECGLNGSTTIYNYKTKKWLFSDPADANVATLPASTFKVINILIALETGTIKDENEIVKWPGSTDTMKYGYRPEIYHDISVKEAFEVSAGWAFVELAKEIDRKVYQRYLDACGYGNHNLTEKGADFWNFGAFGGDSDELDHYVPEQTDHLFRAKLTT